MYTSVRIMLQLSLEPELQPLTRNLPQAPRWFFTTEVRFDVMVMAAHGSKTDFLSARLHQI